MVERNIKLLSIFNFFADFKLYHAIAIIYFSQVTGSFALGMSIFAIAQISSAIFEVPTGIFSDMIGRKKTVILGSLTSVLFVVFYAIGGSYIFLALGAVLEGLARAFYSGNNDAFLHNTLTELGKEEGFPKYHGRVNASFQLALAIGALLGGFVGNFSFQLMMWLSVIPQIICLLLSFFFVEPNVIKKETTNIYAHLKEAFTHFIHNKKLRLLTISSILGYGFGESSFYFQAAFYKTLWPIWAIGVLKFTSHLLATLSFLIAGKIVKKLGEIIILMLSNITSRVISFTALLFPSIVSPILLSWLSIFFGMAIVSQSSLLQKEFTQNQRATMGSLNSFGGSLFFGVFSVILGLVADKFGAINALIFVNFCQFINFFIYLKLLKHHS